MFSAIWLLVAGSFNVVDGATAIHRSSTIGGVYLFSDARFWGWVILIVGILQLVAGFLVFSGNPTGYSLGVFIAAVAMFFWFFLLFVAPTGALIALIMNALVLYGLLIGSYST